MLTTEPSLGELGRRSVRGGLFTVGSQSFQVVLSLASTAILARLLTPRDFGLVAMVTAFTGVGKIFRDMGLSAATVQVREINHAQVSTLFWVNLTIGLATAFMACAIAPAISVFYGEPRLRSIALALASTFVFSGLSVQHQALLQRRMQFGALGAIDIISQAIGVSAGILAAWRGAGYWALVLNSVVASAAGAVGMWIASGWFPGRPVRGVGVRGFMRFGAHLTGGNMFNYLSRNLDNVMIGAVWGAGPVGLYSKAYGLLMAPVSQINSPLSAVAVPALSRLQDDPERYRRFYCRAISLAASLSMPIVAFAYLGANELVLLVFGKAWVGVTPIFRALTPVAFIASFNMATAWVFIPLGRSDRQFRCVLFTTPFVIGSFYVGLPHGPLGVAIACSASMSLLRVPQILYAFHGTPIRWKDLVSALWRSTVSSLFSLCVLLYVMNTYQLSLLWIWKLLVMFFLFFLLYFGCYAVLPNGRKFLKESALLILNR